MSSARNMTAGALKAIFTGGGTPADRMARLRQEFADNTQESQINIETPEGYAAAWWMGGVLLNNVREKLAISAQFFTKTVNGTLRPNSAALSL